MKTCNMFYQWYPFIKGALKQPKIDLCQFYDSRQGEKVVKGRRRSVRKKERVLLGRFVRKGDEAG